MNVNMWLMVHRAEASEQRTGVSLVGGPGAGHRVEDVRSQGCEYPILQRAREMLNAVVTCFALGSSSQP
ncbi:unnamed protein product [Boreogadus saida]